MAIPQIRGGGEFGQDWHDGGRLMNKQNSFNDFIAAAEFLLDTGVTNKERIVINGGSNGGLLVAAAVTQRPDLFRAAIAEVGIYEMVN